MHSLVLLCINQRMKFEVSSFTNSTDIIGTKFKPVAQLSLTNLRDAALSDALHHDKLQNFKTVT